MTTIIDKGGALRKKARLKPGILEAIDDELYDDYLKEDTGQVLESSQSIQNGMIGDLGIMMNDDDENESQSSQDELQYPIEEYPLTPKLDVEDDRFTTPRRKKRLESKKPTLKLIYSQFIDNTKNPNSILTTEDLEQEAIAAMQRGNLY